MNSELFASVLSRTIAYHPVFRDVAGSTVGAVFLSQAYYWSTGQRIPSERAGWFYKTCKEWQEETRLSRSEQLRARRDLRNAGLLEEKRRGRPARLFYRLNIKRLFELVVGLARRSGGALLNGGGALLNKVLKGADGLKDEAQAVEMLADPGRDLVDVPGVVASEQAAEKVLSDGSLQDSALWQAEADEAVGSASVLSEKACEISSMQDSAGLNQWSVSGLSGPAITGPEYRFNNNGLQVSGVCFQVSASCSQGSDIKPQDSVINAQDSAIKAQNPDIKSAESCDLYTEITSEITSETAAETTPQMTAAGVPGPGYEAEQVAAVQTSELTPAAAHSTQPPSDEGFPGSAMARFQMLEGWQPDTQRLKKLCRMRGVSLKHMSPDLYQDLLCEFRTYRASEGLSMSQHKWELKLVDQLMWNQRNRPELFAEPGDLSRSAGPSINRESRYAKPSSGVSGRCKPRNAAERLAASCAGAFDYFQSKASGQAECRTDDLPAAQRADGGTGSCSGAGPGVVSSAAGTVQPTGTVPSAAGTVQPTGAVQPAAGTVQPTGAVQPAAGTVQPATGAVQPATGHETTGRQDAGYGIGQPVVAGEVSGGAGASVGADPGNAENEYSGGIATGPASSVSASGWEYDRQSTAESEHADGACQSGDIWSNPNLWPVSWG